MERRRLLYILKQQLSFHTSRFSWNQNIASSLSCTGLIRSPSEPRVFPTSGWDNVDPSVPVEEESIPTYRPEKFYPVRIGEVFNHRYQVVGKLGYGSSATVWLCRDLLDHRYIALKVYTASTTVTREIEIYNHLRTIQSNHAGQSCLRPLIEIFQAQSPDKESVHTCLVHPPLGISLDQLTRLLPDRVMSSAMVRTTIRNILAALDFLHTDARIIHTDLQPSNILLGIKDNSILSEFETAEFEAPVPRKTLEDRTIYLSRPLPLSYGTPVLCDLGEARLGTDQQKGDIMPDIYRAPEVILDLSWDYKVDIWNVGMVIWDLFEHRHLFRARDPEGKLNDGYHLAEMQAVLGGAPPPELLARSEWSLRFWDENGKWKGAAPVPDYNLEALEERLHGDEKGDFLRFLRRMLCWLPEERATAKELLFDPWLMHGLFK
ncbi:protein kinase domain protein [Aspergillus clavatus NRRL 1]|uniref:Protein kinase domain protein n=1 Tax=Aspergillus clavatus (strain ATCC 1007 / CBS 513.65 / DSM 816 / NCTC 3887 / NRRL 1 / QM 1276 / 107) TaxID=344612 RepID=A1CTQ6_ASPCL|nr:protein kinase domain protein [Aspergillus clavatus NRRL 1]EAW06693.1 protein kinase domain protein [Aspergillus clavatus NRRL 1]